MRDKLIAEYHELLAADARLTPDFLADLRERMRARRLTYGERPLGVSLRPHFLMRSQHDALVRASEALASAFEKIAAALVAEPRLIEEVGLTDAERRLALVEPRLAASSVTTRLDAFVHGDEIKFVEYNAENPSSLVDQNGLNEVLFEVGALERLAGRYRLRQFVPAEALLDSIVASWREWGGGREAPRVAIVDWANLPTQNEFALLRNYFAGRGVPTVICAPDELEYAPGALRRGDFKIDVVYKRVIIHEFLKHCGESHPLARAYAAGDVCVVNPFRCKLMHKKAAFELLTDDERAGWFDEAERETVRRTVPWTRRVRERKTSFGGREVELLELVRSERARFVLKPNDDYGGHGLFLGHRSDESEWDDAISLALAHGDYVVQELVELHAEEFPVFDERGWAVQPMYVDTNPFLFRGRVHGAMVRLSDSPVVNVTSGGGETGFFVVEGEA
ncbi:MAG TPA: hypothetical protein VEQ42_08360 [Pyrinomonadaceae bacterium]|nr:hypothetical protein [Pyrinomonadaceae bacterium]